MTQRKIGILALVDNEQNLIGVISERAIYALGNMRDAVPSAKVLDAVMPNLWNRQIIPLSKSYRW